MNKQADNFSLEVALKEIKEILEAMRANQTDFDQNIKLFQQGAGLIQQSRQYLDDSELLLKRLIDTKDGMVEEEEV